MEEERIITIQEELSKDFYALADVQIDVILRLLEGFEDNQLQVIVQLEGYEWERRRKEAEKKVE